MTSEFHAAPGAMIGPVEAATATRFVVKLCLFVIAEQELGATSKNGDRRSRRLDIVTPPGNINRDGLRRILRALLQSSRSQSRIAREPLRISQN